MNNRVFLTLGIVLFASFAAEAGHHETYREQVVIGVGL